MNKKKKHEREQIVREINKAAQLYKQHLVGKKFLYVFDERYIEVCYKIDGFRHLTGVETNLSAKRFYQYAVSITVNSNIFFKQASVSIMQTQVETYQRDCCISKF